MENLRNLSVELYSKGKRKPVSASGKTETWLELVL